MASSKRPAPNPEFFQAAIARALPQGASRIAVAYSGGVDSTVLLHAAAAWSMQTGRQVIASHVHHGLSPHADAWLAHCATECAALAVGFASQRVDIARAGGESLEAQARHARYAALETLAKAHGADILLTAHHADDQAETVLLNLTRGAGVAGLSGMAAARLLPSGLKLLRPFLDISAHKLRACAETEGWCFIEDDSNINPRFRRNALRHQVMPHLTGAAPAAVENIAQAAAHAAEAQGLLDELGADDFAAHSPDGASVGLDGLRALSRPRAANLLRAWFRRRGVYAPTTAALNAMLEPLRAEVVSTGLRLQHQGQMLCVQNGSLILADVMAAPPQRIDLVWNGEPALPVPEWHGALQFVHDDAATVPEALLRDARLTLRARDGGERIKLHPARPSRTLKNLYQEHGIAPWQRERLPLLYANDQLLMACGLGVDVRAVPVNAPGPRVSVIWRPR